VASFRHYSRVSITKSFVLLAYLLQIATRFTKRAFGKHQSLAGIVRRRKDHLPLEHMDVFPSKSFCESLAFSLLPQHKLMEMTADLQLCLLRSQNLLLDAEALS
jgi:hypothetical protein